MLTREAGGGFLRAPEPETEFETETSSKQGRVCKPPNRRLPPRTLARMGSFCPKPVPRF